MSVTAGAGVQVLKTGLPGVLVIVPVRHGDHRGFFSETWNRPRMAALGLELDFVQDNQSLSAARGTLRGLHYQSPPHAQDKLVRCGRGRLWDVAVDIRRGSPTFGHWHGEELSAANGRQLLVPKGFLHGFVTLEPDTEILYKCTDVYAPQCDGAVRWDDPDLAIAWPAEALGDAGPTLSAKDAAAPRLRDIVSPFVWNAAEQVETAS